MSSIHNVHKGAGTFNLQRFVDAQDNVYETVLAELRRGAKRTHWMWFIFPQLGGLGYSVMSQRYAIKSREEARQYLQHPVLGPRLTECAEAVLSVQGRSASAIFGSPDDMKLHSSMTLFADVAGPESVFARVLDAYFGSKPDPRTLSLLRSHG
jgi:uncharacterized protein (DUF1810 family)